MTEAKHTNEPIDVRDEKAVDVLSGLAGAETSGEIVGEYLEPINFRRFCAAWNACEGIPTEALEDGVVKDMLEALQGLLALYQGQHEYRETTPEEIAAEYAIARATGADT